MSIYTEAEKQRLDYVAKLETHVAKQAEDLLHYRALAEQWTPRFSHSVTDDSVQVTLLLNGKTVSSTVQKAVFFQNSQVDITSAMTNTLLESLVYESLRPLVADEVVKLQQTLAAERNIGTWAK